MSTALLHKLASASFFAGSCLALNSCEALKFIRGQAGIRKAQIAQARVETNSLVIAIHAYHDDHASLPSVEDPENDVHMTTGTELMGVLTGTDKDGNPRQERYFQGPEAVDGKGGLSWEAGKDGQRSVRLLDPWGNEYHLLFDSDFDDEIADPFDRAKRLFGRKAIAWSAGPDGKTNPEARHEDNADNVFSWK